jgi:hypothetical protein
VLDVAHEQVAARIERQAEDEAAGRGDLLQDTVGVAVDLPALTAAPDAPVVRHRDALRMVEARLGERAVDEHPHAEA